MLFLYIIPCVITVYYILSITFEHVFVENIRIHFNRHRFITENIAKFYCFLIFVQEVVDKHPITGGLTAD